MKKNYEELKRFLQSEEQVLKEQKYYHVSKMRMDDEQIITSYPNQEVCQERFVIRQKYKNILIPKHRHEYIELSFMLEGELSMQIEGKEIRMRSGDLCLMDRNVSHWSEMAKDGMWMFNILMTADFFDTIFMYLFSEDTYISNYIINSLHSQSKKKNYIFYHLPEDSFEERIMEQIICEYFMEEQKNMGKITACLILLFTEISRAVGKADEKTIKQNNSKIQQEVIEYLKKHYRDATLNSVAKELCFHPNYLSSLLKSETNKGFKELLFDIRMAEAANLLCRTDMKIDEIAAEIGYANEGYFYKCFKQRYGESPYNYRKKHRSS